MKIALLLIFLNLPLLSKPRVYGGLTEPFSIVFDAEGTVFGVEYENGNRIFQIKNNQLTFIAGSKSPGGKKLGDVAAGDGGPLSKARFNGMHDLTLHPDGRLFIADTFNKRIRVIDLKSKTISTLGGGKLALKSPYTVDLHQDGKRLLVADLERRQILEINLTNLSIRALAGNGKKGKPIENSAAMESPLLAPRAAIYGPKNEIFIASREGHAIRKVSSKGILTTVVNLSGKKGHSGDGGPALQARLNGPKHLSLDPQGRIVICDDNNHAVRLYDPSSKNIRLLAGTHGKAGTKTSQLKRPHGARYDHKGNLWIADSFNHRLLVLP